MTTRKKSAPRLAAISAAAMSALLLAGCSSGNIGESWQCPLAEGGSCDSVAAADPAVPRAAGRTVLAEPLWRVRAAETDTPPAHGPGQAAETPCAADCDGGFDPFAWLARLFGADTVGGETRPAGGSAQASSAPAGQRSESKPGGEGTAPAAPAAEPAAAALPAEPKGAEEDPQADDLRTGEIVARIWIAPFVDAGGIYREASHIRVVLEPAGWRLP